MQTLPTKPLSTSSCRAYSTDFPNSLSLAICSYQPLLPAGHLDYILCSYRIIVDKSLLEAELLRVRENIAFDFDLAPPAVSRMSCSSNLNGV